MKMLILLATLVAQGAAGAPQALPPNTLDCKDWTRTKGIWTSNTDAKPFNLGATEGMLIRGVEIDNHMQIGGYDLTRTLEQKCGKTAKPGPVYAKTTSPRKCMTDSRDKKRTCRIANVPIIRARLVDTSGRPIYRDNIVVNPSGQPIYRVAQKRKPRKNVQ